MASVATRGTSSRHLRDAYNLGPKAEPFDEAKSIETTAYQYFALQILKRTATDHEARYRQISDAAQWAKNTVNKARWADHGKNLLKAWLEGTKEFGETTEQYSDLLYTGVEFGRIFDEATKGLTKLEVAASKLAEEFHKRPGRPKGTAILPWNFIHALAGDYRNSTGKRPGAGEAEAMSRFGLPTAMPDLGIFGQVKEGNINPVSALMTLRDQGADIETLFAAMNETFAVTKYGEQDRDRQHRQ